MNAINGRIENRYAPRHVGAVVLPAVLAAAELRHASGASVTAAIVAGYEAQRRFPSSGMPHP